MPPVQRFVLIFERAVSVPSPDIIAAHKARLVSLAADGIVIMAGPFEGGGGLVVLDVDSAAQAEVIAHADPFVEHGTHHFALRRWLQDLGSSGMFPVVGDADRSGQTRA